MGLVKFLVHGITGIWGFRNSRLKRFAKSCKGMKVLEIGSGTSNYKDFFDSSNEFIQSDYEGRHGFVKLDAANFGAVEEYDAILLMSVLEHIPDFWKVIPNCHRALKKGGRIFIISPMFYPIHRGSTEAREPDDFWRFTEHGWNFLLKDFSSIKIEYNGWVRRFPFSYCIEAKK